MKLSEIAKILGTTFNGNDIEIIGVSDLNHQKTGTIAYVESDKYLNFMEDSPVSAFLLPEGLTSSKKPYISTKKPKESFAKLLDIFDKYKNIKPILKPSPFEVVFCEDHVKIEAGAFLSLLTTVISATIT
ncbi:MAG: hypothetical protein N2258_01210 [Brevinematales bacterium]|nr:hypothetical protein [Brevinematales bacterium]